MPSSRSYPDGALARPDGLNSSAHKHRRNYQSADATAEVMADRDMSVINNISIIGGNSSSRNGFRRPSASSSPHPRRTSSRRPSASSAAKHSSAASQQQQQPQPQQQQELHHYQRSSRSSTSARNSASHSKSRPGSRSKHPSSSQIKYPQSPASPTNHQHHYGSNDHQAAPPSPPASNRNRDSFASIVDDPFFWRYDPAIPNPHPPLDTETDHHLAAATTYYEEEQTDSDESGSEDRWHPSYRESLTIGTNPLVVRASPSLICSPVSHATAISAPWSALPMTTLIFMLSELKLAATSFFVLAADHCAFGLNPDLAATANADAVDDRFDTRLWSYKYADNLLTNASNLLVTHRTTHGKLPHRHNRRQRRRQVNLHSARARSAAAGTVIGVFGAHGGRQCHLYGHTPRAGPRIL